MNITKTTEEYISGHPSIMDCLKKGLINYSALSREICEFYKINSFDAVLIACRRFYDKNKEKEKHEDKVIKLIKSAKLSISNKMAVVIIEKLRDMEPLYLFQKKVKKQRGDFNIIEGRDSITIIASIDILEEISLFFNKRIIKKTTGLVQLAMLFDENIEETSGVVSYIYSLLSDNGINVLEEMSCWTDLMIIIDEKNLPKAMKVLSL